MMEQQSIKLFFAPRNDPTIRSHKRTTSSPSSTLKEPAAKVPKVSEPAETTENIANIASSELSKDDKQPTATTRRLTLIYHKGNIFSAPPNALLIHACNTQGSWGSGIASAFRARYPAAYKFYRDYCTKTHHPATNPVPTGTSLLIPPSETSNGKPKHWIGCVFTSAKYGKAKDTPKMILRNTEQAMSDLLDQVKKAEDNAGSFTELRMCMINSGRFGVPWKGTVEVLEDLELQEGWKNTIEVWSVD